MAYPQNILSIEGVTGITGGWTGVAANTYGTASMRVSWLSDQDTTLNIRQGGDTGTSMFTNTSSGVANISNSVTAPVLSTFANVDIEFASTPSELILQTFFFSTNVTNSSVYSQTIELTGTTGTVTFDNIPQNGSKIILYGNLQSTSSVLLDTLDIQFNGDTGPNYVWQETYSTNNVVGGGQGINVTQGRIAAIGLTGATGINSSFIGTITNYTNTNIYKSMLSTSQGYPAAGYYLIQFGSIWLSNNPITSITLYSDNGDAFIPNSIFTIEII